jgi:hypothetical protein
MPIVRARGMRGFWSPECKGTPCTAQEVNDWCSSASAASPLSYVLCLPGDVTNVIEGKQAVMTGLAPGSVSPGVPVNYPETLPTGVIPGNTQGATEANPYVAEFANDLNTENWACRTLGITCRNPDNAPAGINWMLIAAVVFGGAVLLQVAGGRN